MGPRLSCPPGSLPRPVHGLLFDLGGVLYDDTVWRRWLLQLLRRLGVQTSYRAFYQTWDREYLDDVHRGYRPFAEAFQAFLLASGLTRAQIDEVEAASQARRRQLQATNRPLPGVKATLSRLHAMGVSLGLLTNTDHPGTILREHLDRFSLAGLFSAVLTSIDLGRTMPDPFCYLTALKTMRLSGEQVAFVGHDARELEGARRLGLMTIAFNFDPDASADFYLARFEDLLPLVSTRPPFAAAG